MPNTNEILITLRATATQFDSELKKAQTVVKALESSVQGMQQRLGATGTATSQAATGVNALGSAASRTRDTLGRFTSGATAAGASAQRLGQQSSAGAAGVKTLESSTGSLGGVLSAMGTRMGSFTAGFVTMGAAITGVKAIASAGMGMERLERSFQAITGSVTASRRELDFVRASANRLGLDFASLAEGYKGISAAAMGTALQGDKTKQLFLDIVEAGRALGLSNEQLRGSLRAVGQMASTGTIQLDEMRNELGQHLPIAMTAAARAAGMTGGDFRKLVETGTLLSEDFLPKLGKQLRTDAVASMQAAGGAALSAEQEFTKLASSLKTVIADLGQSDFFNTVAKGAGRVADAINAMREARERLDKFHTGQTTQEVTTATGGAALKPEATPVVNELKEVNAQIERARQRIVEFETTINKPVTQGGVAGWWANQVVASFRREVAVAREEIQHLTKQHDELIKKIQTFKAPARAGTEADLARPDLMMEYQQERIDQQERFLKRTKEIQAEMARIAKDEATLKEQLQRTGVEPLEAAKELARFYDTELKAFQKKFSVDIEGALTINKIHIPATTLSGTSAPVPSGSRVPAHLATIINREAPKYGQDPRLVSAIMQVESNFDPNAVSPKGATGLMQVMPQNWAAYGITNPKDSLQSLVGGLRILQELSTTFRGDITDILTAYHSGPTLARNPSQLGPAGRAYAPSVLAAYRSMGGDVPVSAGIPAANAGGPLPQSTGALEGLTQLRARRDAAQNVIQSTKEQVEAEELMARAVMRNNEAIAEQMQRLKENHDALITGKSGMDEYERGLVQQQIQLKAVALTGRDAWYASIELTKEWEANTRALEKSNEAMEDAIDLGRKWQDTQDDILSGGPEMELVRQAGFSAITDPLEPSIEMKHDLQRMRAEEEAMRKQRQQIQSYFDSGVTVTNSFMGALRAGDQAGIAGARVEELEAQLQGVKKNSEAWLLLKQQIAEARQSMAEFSSAGSQAWMDFASTAINELLRLYDSSTQFRAAMDSIFASIAKGIADLLKPKESSGVGLGELALNTGIKLAGAYFGGGTTGGDITQGGFGTYNMQHGGILPANHRALTGEVGQELMLSQGLMRLVGTRGPEIIRPKSLALVIPHAQTMTLLRQGHSRGTSIPLALRPNIDRQLAYLKTMSQSGKGPQLNWERIAKSHETPAAFLQTQRPARESSVQAMARRETGGSVLAGTNYVIGEQGPEAIIGMRDANQRGGRRNSEQPIIVNLTVNGAKSPEAFVRSAAEIERAAVRAIQQAQRRL